MKLAKKYDKEEKMKMSEEGYPNQIIIIKYK